MGSSKASGPPFAGRAAVIVMQRNAKWMGRKKLATKADVSYRTMSKVESGQPASDDVLAAIAKALDVDFALLKYNPKDDPQYEGSLPTSVEFTIDKPFDEDTSKLIVDRFLRSLQEMTDATSEMVRLFARRGSIKLLVVMPYKDIHVLAQAFVGGKLAGQRVTSILLSSLPEEIRYMAMASLRRRWSRETLQREIATVFADLEKADVTQNDINRAMILFLNDRNLTLGTAWTWARTGVPPAASPSVTIYPRKRAPRSKHARLEGILAGLPQADDKRPPE